MNATGRLHIAATGARLVLERLAHVDRGALRDAGQYVAYFDMDQIVFPITIRSFRPGDRFAPFGLQGTQKLKKYFIDHKIPRAERPRFPLVVSGGEIIWIAGLRRSSRAPVGARSTNILKVELLVA
jgi:tRNA(Ile)-lysidine synthase